MRKSNNTAAIDAEGGTPRGRPSGTKNSSRKMTFGTSTARRHGGRLNPMNRSFNAFPTTPCDECLGNADKHLQTDAGLALYCEHEGALALCEHNRWRVISPLTFDEAAAVLEACVTARKIAEVDDETTQPTDFQPWQPQRIMTDRSASTQAHRRPKAPAR